MEYVGLSIPAKVESVSLAVQLPVDTNSYDEPNQRAYKFLHHCYSDL